MYGIFSTHNFPPTLIAPEHVVREGDAFIGLHACFYCHRAKRKCDRSLPACQSCVRRDLQCHYRKSRKGEEGKFPDKTYGNETVENGINGSKNKIQRITKDKKESHNQHIVRIKKQNKKEKVIRLFFSQLQKDSASSYILGFMAEGSYIDDSKLNIFIRQDNTLEYLGYSPVGPIVINYLNLKAIKLGYSPKLKNKYQLSLPNFHMETSLIKDTIIKKCVDSYFRHFCLIFPVIDEKYLEEKPSLLLTKMVVGIGCRHVTDIDIPLSLIEEMGKEALIEFDKKFLKPSLEVNIAFALVPQFKILANGFKAIWLFASFASTYNEQMGLNKRFPNKIHLTKREKRLRYNIWLSSCIQDKLRIFMVNRQAKILSYEFKVPYPMCDPLPKLSDNHNHSEFILARDALSCTYFKELARLTDLIGHIDAFQKVKILEGPERAHIKAQKLLHSINLYHGLLRKSILNITLGQPAWVHQLSKPLLAFGEIISSTMILNVAQCFLKFTSFTSFIDYCQLILTQTKTLIASIEAQDRHFFTPYSIYTFYTVALGALGLAQILTSFQNSSDFIGLNEVRQMYSKCVNVLDQHRTFSIVNVEFFERIASLLNLDN